MRSSLDEFTKQIGDLTSLVASILPVNTALAGHSDSVVRQYLLIRRRFDYAAFIVALYSSLETFLENLVGEFAVVIAKQKPYSALPSKLTQKHTIKSADLLARGRLGEGRYIGVQPVDVVKNLYDCLTDATPYALNQIAIVSHDLNLRSDEINALFKVIGIEQVCDLVRRVDSMLQWYIGAHALVESRPDSVPGATIEGRIDELVERRNQVAHRGGNPDDLLGPDGMLDMVAFIEAFSKSIFSVVVAKYLQDYYLTPESAFALKLREGPYKNGKVVVVDRPAQRLYVGQPAFVLVPPGARWGRILSLQINDNEVDTVDQAVVAIEVGIGLDFECSKNSVIYVLQANDDRIWSTALPALMVNS